MNKYLLCLTLLPSLSFAEIITDGTLGAAVQLDAPNYQITPDLGQQVDDALFHSFETFNLNAGETATFLGSEQLDYIISRVTGEQASFLNGSILTRGVENIEFYFLNPNGIVFGEQAQLDVNGSLFFSTADTVYLGEESGDGTGEFNATNPKNTLLSVAEPVAFGFLDNDIAPITINGSQLHVNNGNLLALVSGDVQISNGATISALGIPEDNPLLNEAIDFEGVEGVDINLSSGIAIISVGATGTVNLENEETNISINDVSAPEDPIPLFQTNQDPSKVLVDFNGEKWGNISVDENSHLIANSEGNSASLVYLHGEKITFDQQSSITANAYGNQTLTSLGNYIWLFADELILDNQSQILGQKASGTGFGSGVLGFIKENVTLHNQSELSLDTRSEGEAGNIVLFTKNLNMDNSSMSTRSKGSGNGGGIWIQATESMNLYGDEANIVQKIDDLFKLARDAQTEQEQAAFISELDVLTSLDVTKIGGDSLGSGNAGAIFLLTNQLTADTFLVTSETVKGNAGGVFVRANNADIKNFIFSSSVLTEGNGGIVYLDIDDGLRAQGGLFISAARGTASAGNVEIDSNLLFFDKTNVSTSALHGGGGNIDITVDEVGLFSNAQVLASAEASFGNGGDVSIAFPDYLVANHGLILAQAQGGNGGNILIKARNLITSDDTVVSASSNQGIDGSVNVQAPDVNFNEATLVFSPKFAVLNTQVRDMCKVRITDQLPTEFQLDYSFIVSPFSGQYSQLEDWQPSYTRSEFALFKRNLSDLARCSFNAK
ncbi:filamentous hemagglutinin N-terminal domain-containing protein [Candidatus Albibeggiatoa sp. nov. NOAA]|uniref:two-partner secretion domain-containing protein n=1 Tax=Candidatus Albibeggiatoa sp. nov. NOAA TaxID=3162724 RepID=UPI0032FA6AF2|nr:filamentous hemagglutinin N-terminal domain-containing protein [Thiotrichaceae bacterium]